MNDHFKNGKYKERAQSIQRAIDFEVQKDPNKLYDYEGFKTNLENTAMAKTSKIIGIIELMDARTEYLSNHPIFQKAPPTIANVTHLKEGNDIQVKATITGNEGKDGQLEKAYLVYKSDKTKGWQIIEMFDDGGHHDGTSNDTVYGASFEWSTNTKYYIIAEGERIAALSPERASYEFYEVK